MIKIKEILSYIVFGTILISCNKIDDIGSGQPQPLTYGTITRGTSSIDNQWKIGDKITLISSNRGFEKTLEFDGYSWKTEDGKPIKSQLPATCYGIYPQSATSDLSISTDQSSLQKMLMADIMSTQDEQVSTPQTPLNLTFVHILSKVEITISEYKSEFGGIIPSVTAPSLKSYIQIERKSLSGKAYAYTKGVKQSINPLFTKNINGKHKIEAIIAPGIYGSEMLSIEINGKKVKAVSSTGQSIQLQGGRSYKFNLVVGKDAIILNLSSVTDFARSWIKEIPIDFVPPKIGEYLYDDGSYGPYGNFGSTKKAIGVIFSVNPTQSDIEAGYYKGYALALYETNLVQFKTSATTDGYGNMGWNPRSFLYTIENNRDGLTYTMSLNDSDHPAVKAAIDYKSKISKDISSWASDWFIPGYGQWCEVAINLGKMSDTPYKVYRSWTYWNESIETLNNIFSRTSELNNKSYWTSSYNNDKPINISFSYNYVSLEDIKNSSKCRVRPAIAF